MRSFIRTFLLSGFLGGLVFGFYFGVVKGFSLFWSGIVAGLVSGLAVAMITRFQQNRVAASPPVLTDEAILRQGPATYDDMAGRLYLTDRRILFEGYPTVETSAELSTLFEGRAADDPDHLVSIPILRIAEVKEGGLRIGSRLSIILTDGETKNFGTEYLDEWVDDISTARQKLLDEPRSESMKLFP